MNSSNQPINPASNLPVIEPSRSLLGGVWTFALGALLLVCGAGAGIFYLVTPLVIKDAAGALQANTLVGSVAAIGIFFGALLAWQGVECARGRAPRPAARAFPPAMLLCGGFLVILVLGIGALALQPLAPFAFPPLHFLAASLPPLALVALAARRLNVQSGLRALIAALSWGALGSTLLALSLEALIGVIMIVGVSAALALSPEGAAQIEQLSRELYALRAVDERALAQFVLAHPLILVLALTYFAGIVPLIEEAVKPLSVAFADARRTRRDDVTLWGLAAGAGFALSENALNTSVALEWWSLVMLARIGATVMHAANGITMARGWYAARVERRWSRLVIAYGISVLIHSAWNALTLGLGVGAVGLIGERDAFQIEAARAWGMLALTLGLIVLMFGGMGWIVFATRSGREPPSQPSSLRD